MLENKISHLVSVLPVPLVQKVNIIAHGDQGLSEHLQLCSVNLWWDRAVAISVNSKVTQGLLSK